MIQEVWPSIDEGEFDNDQRRGHGIFTYVSSGTICSGQWNSGNFTGHGEIKYTNGDKYIGNLVAGQ